MNETPAAFIALATNGTNASTMERIGIVGAGLIGRAYAVVIARAGHEVAIYDGKPGGVEAQPRRRRARRPARRGAAARSGAGCGAYADPPRRQPCGGNRRCGLRAGERTGTRRGEAYALRRDRPLGAKRRDYRQVVPDAGSRGCIEAERRRDLDGLPCALSGDGGQGCRGCPRRGGKPFLRSLCCRAGGMVMPPASAPSPRCRKPSPGVPSRPRRRRA